MMYPPDKRNSCEDVFLSSVRDLLQGMRVAAYHQETFVDITLDHPRIHELLVTGSDQRNSRSCSTTVTWNRG